MGLKDDMIYKKLAFLNQSTWANSKAYCFSSSKKSFLDYHDLELEGLVSIKTMGSPSYEAAMESCGAF